ncbi:metal-dependent hydrolase [Vibrio vulnificus]|nr:metal-dependent hydrolase [Vibrio vulnificus]
MTGAGHTLTGILSGIPLAYLTVNYGGGVTAAVTTVACCTLGSTAPDWLEIPYSAEGKDKQGNPIKVTKRVLKHRGITHILSVWVALFLWSFIYLKSGVSPFIDIGMPIEVIAALFGFFGGCIVHWIGDFPNKQKLPVFTTLDGVSLNVWQSGNFERTTGAIILFAVCSFVFFEEPIYQFLKEYI